MKERLLAWHVNTVGRAVEERDKTWDLNFATCKQLEQWICVAGQAVKPASAKDRNRL